jgi:hypothetical protein
MLRLAGRDISILNREVAENRVAAKQQGTVRPSGEIFIPAVEMINS